MPLPRTTHKHAIRASALMLSLGILATASVVFFRSSRLTASLTPPAGVPQKSEVNLDDIYTRITTNQIPTPGSHPFFPTAAPASTLHTLTQVYNAIPTIDPLKIKNGSSLLGVNGTLTPAAGVTANAADVFTGKTLDVVGTNWTVDTGSLMLACDTNSFDATNNLVDNAHDGNVGNGTNRWCMTNTGDAAAGDITNTKRAWVDGVEVSGTMPVQTLLSNNTTVNAGVYATTTLTNVDPDLKAANIKSGVSIFGITGNYVWGYGMPKTGQTSTYATSQYCADGGWGTCDDGYYHTGKPASGSRFTDNNDGTVTDNGSGLIWQKCHLGSTYDAPTNSCIGTNQYQGSLPNAINNCKALRIAGRSDWRLPNIFELSTLVDYSKFNPALDTTIFTNVPTGGSSVLLSSTTDNVDKSTAYGIGIYNGTFGNTGKNCGGGCFAYCVLAGPP